MVLPTPSSTVQVHLLNGGSMTAEYHKLHAGEPPAKEFRMYNWCFLIHHNSDDFPPVIANGVIKEARVLDSLEPLTAQIQRRAGITAEEIDTVILRPDEDLNTHSTIHAHFDHARPLSPLFPNATAYFGPGTVEYCAPGHLSDPSSPWDGRYFDPSPGNVTKWVGLQGKEGEWVVLGSDCCHSRALLDGTKSFGTFDLPNGNRISLHTDADAAHNTLVRPRILKEMGMHIALAHDASWMEERTDEVLMSSLDERFCEDVRGALKRGKPF
ncbi:hypothetical protein BJX62DRAFT_247908 [Aspergillus germanicus]